MTKLLSAGLSRLRVSKIFWLGMMFMFGMAVLVVLNQHASSIEYGVETTLDNFILGYALMIPVAAAVFCSLFLGAEYSDGTIRNKLIVGHSRVSVYLSSLVMNIAATLLMCLAFLVGACAVGIPLLGGLKTALPQFFAMLAGSVMMVCAICAILTAVCMLIPNKTIIAIVSILGMIGCFALAMQINTRLTEPEFYPPGMFMAFDGGFQVSEEAVPNPNYLTGVKRTVYEYAYDILPTGQAFQYASMSAEHLWQMPSYSLAIVLISSWLGVFFFRRKDLK